MPRAYRMVRAEFVKTAFTGEGASLAGGRWNSSGVRVVYCSGTVSLAALELLAHLGRGKILDEYRVIQAVFDDAIVETVERHRLPPDWGGSPGPHDLRRLGDQWVRERRSAVLCVPSAVVPSEVNYLLNPTHPQFEGISIGKPQPFQFDSRLLK